MLDPQKVIKEACTGLFEQFFSFINQYMALHVDSLGNICSREILMWKLKRLSI